MNRYHLKSLDGLRDTILDNNDGPRWYEFLSRSITYGVLYNRCAILHEENKQLLRQYERTNARLAVEKDGEEQRAIRIEKDLEHE